MIGTGYVGLVSGACLAACGHTVKCIDINPEKIAMLNKGECPLYEEGLPELLKEVTSSGHLTFSTDLPENFNKIDAIFLGVGTPQDDEGRADMTYIDAAFKSLIPKLTSTTVVVTKSTVPVGTCARYARMLHEVRPELEGHIASNPEFLREGTAVDDFTKPDRIVTGSRTQHAADVLKDIYKPLEDKGYPHIQTDPQSSEIIKYAANAFLATKIGFINEMAALCEKIGGNVGAVAQGMGLDTRIGHKFLKAGPGYGGSCFPKDTSALTHIARDAGLTAQITSAAMKANFETQARMVDKIEQMVGNLKGKTIACLGLAFKPGTDDMRDSPALTIIPALQKRGAIIKGTDIAALEHAKSMLDIEICATVEETVQGADILVMMTEWPEYKNLDFQNIVSRMTKDPAVADLRRFWSVKDLTDAGFVKTYKVGE
jgi:UDPglucose 6-dehydrogenase